MSFIPSVYCRYLNDNILQKAIQSQRDYSLSAIFCARFAKAAAKSECPPALILAPPPALPGGEVGPGLDEVGIGGFIGALGAPGFAARGGGAGFGLVLTGGAGLPATELEGLEISSGVPADGDFFHGVAEPLGGIMPGNTETGFAEASAYKDWASTLGVAIGVGVCFTLAGAEGGRRRLGGGGGGGVALGCGGASSR